MRPAQAEPERRQGVEDPCRLAAGPGVAVRKRAAVVVMVVVVVMVPVAARAGATLGAADPGAVIGTPGGGRWEVRATRPGAEGATARKDGRVQRWVQDRRGWGARRETAD